jgi:hypothetical protein
MKNNRLIHFLLAFILFSCSKSEKEKKIAKFTTNYQLVIYDTLRVEAIGNSIFPTDFTENGFLFVNLMSPDTVYHTDKNGKLLNKFKTLGNDPDHIGNYLYSVGYLSDTSVVVIGSQGMQVVDMQGNVKKTELIHCPFVFWGGIARALRVREYRYKNQTYLLSYWFPFTSSKEDMHQLSLDRKLYESKKHLTIFNYDTKAFTQVVPFEENSPFLKNKNINYFEDHFFDYANATLYSLISPEQTLYTYEVQGNKIVLKDKIDLFTNNFELREQIAWGQQEKPNSSLYVNSAFRTLDVSSDGRYVLLSYESGIPMEEYKKMQSLSEGQTIDAKFNKRYLILLENNKQNASPIRLPNDVMEVALFKSPDYILLAYEGSFGTEDKTTFYVARLEKVQ